MIIKYRCWDEKKREFRRPDPENMVSKFIADSEQAMRIVQMPGYEFNLWTGFEDRYGSDIFAGDILDDRYFVKWDPYAGAWRLFDNKFSENSALGFDNYRPQTTAITGNIYQNPEWLS